MPVISNRDFGLPKPDGRYWRDKLPISYSSAVNRGERVTSGTWEQGKPYRATLPDWLQRASGEHYVHGTSEADVEAKVKELAEFVIETSEQVQLRIGVRVSRRVDDSARRGRRDQYGALLSITFEVVRSITTFRGGNEYRSEHFILDVPDPAPPVEEVLPIASEHKSHGFGASYYGGTILDYTPERLDRIRHLCGMLDNLGKTVEDFLADDGLRALLDGERQLALTP